MKQQVVVIHGGDTFGTYNEYIAFLKDKFIDSLEYFRKSGWKQNLQENLGEEYEVIMPEMPNRTNANYLEWQIWFDKLVPFIRDNVILVGHSLGGIFLAKYLSENSFPKRIRAALLVAPPFDSYDADYTLASFDLILPLGMFRRQCEHIAIYHSVDDPVVPFTDVFKYLDHLPSANVRTFENRGHFSGNAQLPEMVEEIRSLTH